MLAPSHEQDPGRSRSLADDPRIHDGAPRSGPDEDDRPARQHCLRPRPPAGVKAKGKQRALARSVSPPSQSDIWRNSPAARHEPTASPEISTAPTGSPLSENSSPAERSTTAASRPAGDVRSEGAGPPVSPRSESNSGGSRVPSPPLPDGNSNTAHATRTTDASPFPLEELHSLNDGIVASSRAKSETPEPLTINLNHPRTNLVRQARYRSQRDAIIAHLRASSTTRKNRSSAQPRHKSSLLARTTDEAVEKLNVPEEVDADITEGASGGAGCARLPSRTAERSSGPSVNDDPSGRRRNENETTVTKAWTGTSRAISHKGQKVSRLATAGA
ncbi:hypothetical protein BC826DRAFT_120051 [Russula brevipes]|nr:hypothetical protein BC826DRAFT_120051 [Russula brevipes]